MRLLVLCTMLLGATAVFAADATDPGVLPVGDDGQPVNTDFETGTLKDWTTIGNAFKGQPIKGDTINERRGDSHSRHAGNYWIGTFEVGEDGPRGTMTSVSFKVTHPWASFLIGGGVDDERVEIVRAEDQKIVFQANGENLEDMQRVAVDLREQMGKKIFIRVTDDHSFSWGHVNFDDFKVHADEPKIVKHPKLTPDVVKFAGLPPKDAVKAITLPAGFKATLFAGEPDVNQPVGFAIDDRGRLWVAEAYTYPTRQPEGKGKDKIIIFEDADGDGVADKRTVFMEGLNLVSGIELGYGGVWIGAAPYFMFIPIKEGEDKPAGPPQILLDGFAYQDTHETLNTFTWGPDGWLYGCHGVFTHSRVGKPGTPDDKRIPINAGIWRYHPTQHIFEVFAEGTSNPWGVDFNDWGQAFSTACVIPHLYHIIQGARYQRQAGEHFNPYIYKDIQNIGDHVHWVGDKGPHAGNGSSDAMGGGHAHCGAMIYLGDSWPDEYRNSIFMNNIHGNRTNNDFLVPKGSGYVGTHHPDFMLMNDRWARLINLKYGPDGSVYVIDWYDKQACHNPETEIWDRTNGRIYKIIYKDQPAVKVDVAKLSDEQLVQEQLKKNEWYVRHAQRLLAERNVSPEAKLQLLQMLRENRDGTRKLRALWALNAAHGLTSQILIHCLADNEPYVRAWAIQLAAERGEVSEFLSTFEMMAKEDASPVVRLYLASALQRMPVEQRWGVLEALIQHKEDVDDHNLPPMIWYAAEPAVGASAEHGMALANKSAMPLLRELITRRITAATIVKPKIDTAPLSLLAKTITATQDASYVMDILNGMTAGLRGRRNMPMPDGWEAVHAKYSDASDENLRQRVRELSTIFGDERALAELRKVAGDKNADGAERVKAIESLLGANDAKAVPILKQGISDSVVQAAAIRGLAHYDDNETAGLLLKIYPSLDPSLKGDVLNTLSSRLGYAQQLQAAIKAGAIATKDLPAATLRQLRALDDKQINVWLADTFGQVKQTSEDKINEIARLKAMMTPTRMAKADAWHGHAMFAKTCAQCHTLFGDGGKVGPDFTGSNRADTDYVLSNIIDPSAVVGKQYLASIIKLKDDRLITGIVKSDDGSVVTVTTDRETLTIPKTDILRMKQSEISMMPEGLIHGVKDTEVRDLMAYLKSTAQTPVLANRENVSNFFNGKDLSGWIGDPSLWSVENGEIVGRTTSGLKKNQFLVSKMAAENFRLTVQIKLVKNEGNSGIQFRSEALSDGEMKGYQADVGVGWWGKLYEENGRALLVNKPFEQFVKPGEWNTYEVFAFNSQIRTAINGHECVNFDDPSGSKRGVFAFQLHAGGPTEVRFKDIKLEVDPQGGLKSLK